MKVLLATTDPSRIRHWQFLLEGSGHDIVLADSADVAWGHLQAESAPHIAVLNLDLPQVSGAELCRQLRSAGQKPYIYVLLVSDSTSDVAEAFSAGADNFFLNDASDEEFLARLECAAKVSQRIAKVKAEHDSTISLLLHSPMALACIRPDGSFVHANPAFLKLVGTQSQSLSEVNIRSLYSQKVDWEHLAKWLSQSAPFEGEVRWKRQDGREITVQLAGSPMDQGNANSFFEIVATDLTDKRQLEQEFLQAQKMEAVGRLAGGVAHDFNNLLTVILGYSDLLIASSCSAGVGCREKLDSIKRAANKAADLTRQLLAFSRRQKLQPCVLDLNATIRDVQEMIQRLIGEDVELTANLQARNAKVLADRSQLQQVIMNLIVNARDAMPNGGKLLIQTAERDVEKTFERHHLSVPAGRYVAFSVTDSGCGMDEHVRARIFEPFFTTKADKGTGLGLATVYGIVQQSGGLIWVDSQVGSGSTFEIYLPQANGKTPQAFDVVPGRTSASSAAPLVQ